MSIKGTQGFSKVWSTSILVAIMMCVGFSIQVMAQDPVQMKVVDVSGNPTITPDDSGNAEIYIELGNVEAYYVPPVGDPPYDPEDIQGIKAIQFALTYDSSKLEIKTIDGVPDVVAFGKTALAGTEPWPIEANIVVDGTLNIALALNPADPTVFNPDWYGEPPAGGWDPPIPPADPLNPWGNVAEIYALSESGFILKIGATCSGEGTVAVGIAVLQDQTTGEDLAIFNEKDDQGHDTIPVDIVPGVVGCICPVVITNVDAECDGSDVTISWDTDVETNYNVVYYGTVSDPGSLTDEENATDGTHHEATLSGLSDGTYYYYVVSDCAVDDNDGGLYQFTLPCVSEVLKLTIPKVCGAPNQPVVLPINIEFLQEGLQIISLDITITYDANSGWTETDPSIAGTLAETAGWTLTKNMSSGQDVISVSGANPVGDNGTILNLNFTAGASPSGTDVNITTAASTDSGYNDITMEQFAIVPGKLDLGGVALSITSGCIAVGKDKYGTGIDIIVPFPVNIENQNAMEIIAVDLTVSYDETIVTAGNPTLGTLAETAGGWAITPNLTQPGKVILSAYGATPITDNGAIVNLNFVSNDFFKELRGQSTNLEIDSFNITINGGSEVSCADTVGGTITAAGLYGDINNGGTHSGGDAAMVAQIVVGLLTPTSYQKKCADVNLGGTFSGGDAAIISQKVVGLLTQLPPQSILDNATGEKLRNCYDSTAAPVNYPVTPSPITALSRNAELQAKLQSKTEPFVVQLNVDNVDDVLSSDIVLSYDESLVNFIDVSTTVLTSDSMLVYNNVGGKVLVCLYGPKSLSGSGSILNFRFAPVQNSSYNDLSSAIVLSRIMLNDGIPAVRVENQSVSMKIIPTSYQLLQNYPNPFNPETWIPYDLPQTTDVVIKIYDASGKIIRRLDLGTKPAGRYLTKTEAAYWEGRNEQGESVASGLYYYQLQAGTYSAIKKLVVLK